MPHGTHATVQGAVDALVSGWVNDVRVETGTYGETFEITIGVSNISSGEAHLSGGVAARTPPGPVAHRWCLSRHLLPLS